MPSLSKTDSYNCTVSNPKLYSFFSSASVKLATLLLLILSSAAHANGPEYFNSDRPKSFFVTAGLGFGISNNPVLTGSAPASPGGMTLSGALGYRFNRKFSLDFGPAFWLDGKDVFDNSAQNNERPTDKRTLVSLNGYYQPFARTPLQFKAGAGFGSLVFTPRQQVISDKNGESKTEITNGFGFTAGLVYEVKVAAKFHLYPSVNFWYTNLEPQKIAFISLIDDHRPSLIGDFRINIYMYF